MSRLTLFALLLLLLVAQRSVAAPVQVLGFDFTDAAKRLTGYRFTHLETGANHSFGADGRTMLDLPVGYNVTINFPAQGAFHQTMGPTVVVPPEGMTTEATEYVMQVPSKLVYDFFNLVTPGKKNPQLCQFVVTIAGGNCPPGYAIAIHGLCYSHSYVCQCLPVILVVAGFSTKDQCRRRDRQPQTVLSHCSSSCTWR